MQQSLTKLHEQLSKRSSVQGQEQIGFKHILEHFAAKQYLRLFRDFKGDFHGTNRSREPLFSGSTLSSSYVHGTRWTVHEKRIFFQSLARHGRRKCAAIAADIRTKTEAQVYNYISLLETQLRYVKKRWPKRKQLKVLVQFQDIPAAMEMSDEWVEWEELQSQDFIQKTNVREEKTWKRTCRKSNTCPSLSVFQSMPAEKRDACMESQPMWDLFDMNYLLECSGLFYIRSEDADMRTDFLCDIYDLVKQKTKELVTRSLELADLRLSSTESSSCYRRSAIVKPNDVVLAVKLGEFHQHDIRDFWVTLPQRLGLEVTKRNRFLGDTEYAGTALNRKRYAEPNCRLRVKRRCTMRGDNASMDALECRIEKHQPFAEQENGAESDSDSGHATLQSLSDSEVESYLSHETNADIVRPLQQGATSNELESPQADSVMAPENAEDESSKLLYAVREDDSLDDGDESIDAIDQRNSKLYESELWEFVCGKRSLIPNPIYQRRRMLTFGADQKAIDHNVERMFSPWPTQSRKEKGASVSVFSASMLKEASTPSINPLSAAASAQQSTDKEGLANSSMDVDTLCCFPVSEWEQQTAYCGRTFLQDVLPFPF
ncbi:RNA polymerase I upstream activation factor complex subunit Rrn5 [Schizosaccharomyces japonicus yFS275]|uniref:RNA polymerase I upstream activation factor complex subunit Rrn5 n=1 Tax=Schizosaccharomyces japonicus (strain yFS275 / FY16936) TaxID=402676 RepID=B6K7Q0_SCHJY|nr:RNA polymerase I upstream activation factor complex subunit Rrn5 [Schizosaccharomyces japonicus yFS275]EEB09554.1 RNA polymerase I upstream activation factor complex subunit Rrn5 [Schizosaccharomyces japonicus yFS275]